MHLHPKHNPNPNRSKFYINLAGQRFGKLTAIEWKQGKWRCLCDCGQESWVITANLRNGHTQSCGCKVVANISRTNYKHGESKTKLWHLWSDMIARCHGYRPSDKYWAGRGITVCESWKEYINFRDWAVQDGYKPGLSIDRIDNDRDYEPSNCRWVTMSDQQRNKTTTKFATIHGVTHRLPEWAEISGIKYFTLLARLKAGWAEDDLLLPLVERGKHHASTS